MDIMATFRVGGGAFFFWLLVVSLFAANAGEAKRIVIGGEQLGWVEGVCYRPVQRAMVGDTLVFNFLAHDVYRMHSREHFDKCDFSDSVVVAGIGESPFEYEIVDTDEIDRVLYFACSVGDHCGGGTQKVQVYLEPFLGQMLDDRDPVSQLEFGLSSEACAAIQNSTEGGTTMLSSMDSSCTDPELGDDGRYYRSCLSPKVTLTPGGVVNNLYMVHYPFPHDERVLVGLRTWEFVYDDPGKDDGSVIPSPSNQLYVHHIAGSVILGQGHEGLRRSKPDAPFPSPYGVVTGDDGEFMIFHIIDLREVDDWLPCLECRCKDPSDGTYLNIGGSDGGIIGSDGNITTGGISCCYNCTDLTGPTLDYRMRYNVSYSFIKEENPVKELMMLITDISPVLNKIIEFDVPGYQDLRQDLQKETDPSVQRLVREEPFNVLFKSGFFQSDYEGPDTVRLFRCVGHLHIAAIGMWLEDAETGEMLCSGVGSYGTDPSQDKGFLTAIHVDDYEEPKVFPADRVVRLITEYNATELHTGVMGLYFVFIDGEREITAEDTALSVDICIQPTCDTSMLPRVTMEEVSGGEVCEDTLTDHAACKLGGLCDCETVINAPESTGCGGAYSTDLGDMQVNSVCAKSCGCPSTTCSDALPNTQACSVAQLCDCETFVNHEFSTGCGGIFTTQFGPMKVNDYCANYCNACPQTTMEELMVKEYAERLEADLKEKCHFSTKQCRKMLNNAYSCSMETPGLDAFDETLRRATVNHAGHLALKYSKLGAPSLHSDAEDIDESDIHLCVEEQDGDSNSSTDGGSTDEDETSAAASITSFVLALIAMLAAVVL